MSTAPSSPALSLAEPSVRVVYRKSNGSIELDWPVARIKEALGDVHGTVWVDIEDLDSNFATVEQMMLEVFHFHPLAIDDALAECHVPKIDDWGRYLYLVFHTIDFDPETDDLRLHELDIFLGTNYVVTYHTEPLEVLTDHRKAIERDPGNRLKHGADHLLYHLIDRGVAQYLPAIEHLDEAIDDAQDEVFDNPTRSTLQNIFRVKRSALRLNRILAPQRELLNKLARDPYDQVANHNRVYFRDAYDHMVRIHDITESLRDLISSALDTYLSAISNRTNDIMKTLTLVTVMFLPMSFLAGFFGMNFFGETLMFTSPEIPKWLIFLITCAIMIATPGIMFLWAKRRNWF